MTEHHSRAYTNSKSTKEEGKKKTAESELKERGSELKTMSNEFMDSVGYPLANDPPQFLVHPPGLAVPEERVKV